MVVTFEENKATENAIKIKGLLLQGCAMNKHLLGSASQNDQ
jgi:hypothetical protein